MQKTQLFILLLLALLFMKNGSSQPSVNAGVGAVAEIIVPAQINMRSNFNLMYQVQFSREEIPNPSFWYKIVFGDSCSFKFSLFPLNERDRYDFYLYKIRDNYNFCAALDDDKIISCDSSKIQATTTKAGEKASLVGVKSINANAGDAIYLEVINTKGWDGGHMLDFKISDSSSFVVKVQNDYEDTTRKDSNVSNLENTFKNISDKEMQRVFCKTLSSAETEPHHLLYTKEQARKDSIAIANNQRYKKKEEISKVNVKSKSTIAIFNTIKNKPLSKAKNPVYLESYIPEKGVIYKIQVGFYMSQVPPILLFKGLSPVFQEKMPVGAKYSVGAFTTYELVAVAKGFVKSLGIDAFVTAYYNGKRVTIAEAQSHENEKN